ncbi:Subtilase family protein [Sphingomonas jatrophae]|uniref:Subtilase family protein n=1 Tax=Sphingomonas jatrophae TaxID=1166337 RepID=A0A1I6JW16_9SPHN|nr:Subtilase family protein [Sphingomonas jatrophae]
MRLYPLLAALAVIPAGVAARPLVAVIDSGVAMTPELRPLLRAEYDFGSPLAPRPAFHPRYDHGTMVATILARAAHGGADIISLRVDDPAGCAPDLTPPCQPDAAPLAAAIRKASALGANVINISLTLKSDPAIRAAVADATKAGATIVLAAGNEGRDRPGNLAVARAGYPNTVLVGALDASGRPWSGTNRPTHAASGYAYVWQPGVDVVGATAAGQPAMGTGTSFAAPIESGRLVTALAASESAATRLATRSAAR